MMKLLFIGGLYPKERYEEINTNIKVNYQFAADNLQWAIIEGLSMHYKYLDIITAPTIGSYPKGYSKIYFPGCKFENEYAKGSNNICVKFINLPILNLFFKYFGIKSELKRWLKKNENSNICIIVYSPHTPFLKSAIANKKKYKNLKVSLIVPDLPNFMSDNNNLVYKFLKKIDSILLNRYIKKVDSFVLLSKHMIDPLEINNRKWILVEGIHKDINIEINVKQKNNEKIILYTGALTNKDGIFTLIEAFKKISDKNYKLWLRGNGPILNQVSDIIKNDNRIKLIGPLSREKLILLQKEATVLINPTPSTEKSSKYFFPSKMMDYLASGTPTITNRLEGIPNEYFTYCFVTNHDDAEGLKNKIVEVCEKSQEELNKIGTEARNFILTKKNPYIQTKRIHDMINS